MEDKYQIIKTVACREEYKTRLVTILKNETTGEKIAVLDDEPKLEYYVDLDCEYRTPEEINSPPQYVKYKKLDEVRKCTSNYNNLYKDICLQLGRDNDMKKWIHNKISLKRITSDPCLHGSDINIEDFYISQHYQKYPFESLENKLNKSFFDIEVDSYGFDGFPLPEDALCPINAISFFDEKSMTLFGFFLNNKENPLIEKLKQSKKQFVSRIKNKYKEKYDLDIKISIKFFDDELHLIKTFFDVIHYLKPDVVASWNLCSFDIKYIINRLFVLNQNPPDYICDPSIPYDYFKLYEDLKNQDFADCGSNFTCSDYSIWIDQMLLFAAIRKGQGKQESYSLDAIVGTELNEAKVSLDDFGGSIKNIPYTNYEHFIEYNLHDTMLLFLLEKQNQDFDTAFTISGITQTRISHIMRKTISVRNLARRFYFENGYVMSNNHNIDDQGQPIKKVESFRGAFVANPNLNDAVGIELSNQQKSQFIFDDIIDFDAKALYPSTIRAFNIDTTTMIYRLLSDEVDMAQCLEDFVSHDYINIGKKYFNLPDVSDILKVIDNG